MLNKTHWDKYKVIAKKMGDFSRYMWGQIPDMVGYTAEGSSADYFYMMGQEKGYQTFSMGVEAGTSKQPSASEIPTEANANYQALLVFMKEAPIDFTTGSFYAEDEVPELPIYDHVSQFFVPGEE